MRKLCIKKKSEIGIKGLDAELRANFDKLQLTHGNYIEFNSSNFLAKQIRIATNFPEMDVAAQFESVQPKRIPYSTTLNWYK